MGSYSNDSVSSDSYDDSSEFEEFEADKHPTEKEKSSSQTDLSPERNSDEYLASFPNKQVTPLDESQLLSTQHADLIPDEDVTPLSDQTVDASCDSLLLSPQTITAIPTEPDKSLFLSDQAESLSFQDLVSSSDHAENMSNQQTACSSMYKISTSPHVSRFSDTNHADPIFNKYESLPPVFQQTDSIPHKISIPSSESAELFPENLLAHSLSSQHATSLGDQCQQIFFDDVSPSLGTFEGSTEFDQMLLLGEENYGEWKKMAMENYEIKKANKYIQSELYRLVKRFARSDVSYFTEDMEPDILMKALSCTLEDYELKSLQRDLSFKTTEVSKESSALSSEIDKSMERVSKLVEHLQQKVDEAERSFQIWQHLDEENRNLINFFESTIRYLSWKLNILQGGEFVQLFLGEDAPFSELIIHLHNQTLLNSILIQELGQEKRVKLALIQDLLKLVWQRIFDEQIKMRDIALIAKRTNYDVEILRVSSTEKASTVEPEEISKAVSDRTSKLERKIKRKKDEIKRLKEKKLIAENEIAELTLNYNEAKQKYEKFQNLAEIIQQEVSSYPSKVMGDMKFKNNEPNIINQPIRFSDSLSCYNTEPPSHLLREYLFFCAKYCNNGASTSQPKREKSPAQSIHSNGSIDTLHTSCNSSSHLVRSSGSIVLDDDDSIEKFRVGSPQYLSPQYQSSPSSIDSSRSSGMSSHSSLTPPSPISMNTSFLNRTYNASLSPQLNRTFDGSPPPQQNMTFDKSEESIYDGTFDMSSPELNKTFSRSLSPQFNTTSARSPSPQRNTTFSRSQSPHLNATFARSPSPELNTTFDINQSPQLNATYARSQSPQLNATFARSHSPQLNATFARSPSPQLNTTFDINQPPQLNATYARSPSPRLNATFARSQSPQLNATFARSPSPQLNTTFDINQSPQLNATYARSQSPRLNATFARSQSPQLNATFATSQSPQLNTTFGIIPSPQLNRTFETSPRGKMLTSTPQRAIPVTPNQIFTPLISRASRFGYTDPGARVLNIPPGDDLDIPTPYRQAFVLDSPQRGEPLFVNIDVEPQPIIETDSGEHIICDISVDIHSSGQDQLSPVITYGTPPAVTPTTTRRHGMFTPRGIFRKKHFNVRRIYEPDESDEYYDFDLPRSPQYLPRDARTPVGPLLPSPKMTDKSISWEKDYDHPAISVMNRTFAASPAMNRTFATSPAMNRTFATSPAMNRTFAAAPAMNRTFEAPSVLNRTYDARSPQVMNRTFEAPSALNRTYGTSSPRVINRTFDKSSQTMNRTYSPDAMMNQTFSRSPSPFHESSFYGMTSSPQVNRTFHKIQSPTYNQTFTRSPVFDGTFERGQSPALNRTFNKSQSPVLNRTFNRSISPQLNQTFNRSMSPQLNQTFNRSISPVLNRTFDLSSQGTSPLSSPYASPGSRSYDASGSYNNSSSYSRSISPQVNRTFSGSPAQNVTFDESFAEEYYPEDSPDLNKSFYI